MWRDETLLKIHFGRITVTVLTFSTALKTGLDNASFIDSIIADDVVKMHLVIRNIKCSSFLCKLGLITAVL